MGIYPGLFTTYDVAWQIPAAPQITPITVKVGDEVKVLGETYSLDDQEDSAVRPLGLGLG